LFSAAATPDDNDDAVVASGSSSSSTEAYVLRRREGVRNVAIIAHVDHGKTTLVDELLKAATSSAPGSDGGEDLNRLMDSGELEMERGITITSKVTRLDYVEGETTTIINVVDTPGHADFAGEVDRILGTVDGVVLVVDAAEGPKSQTKYVLGRALAMNLRPIVVLNKCDREESSGRIESGETECELIELFDALGASEEAMEYRTMYASARGGWVTNDAGEAASVAEGKVSTEEAREKWGMKRLFDAIMTDVPKPPVHWYGDGGNEVMGATEFDDVTQPFTMTATTVGYDSYLGRTCTGRIHSGAVTMGDAVSVLPRESETDAGNSSSPSMTSASSQVSGVFANRGVSRSPLDPPLARAGDIVTLAGMPDSVRVGDTVTSTANPCPRAVHTPPLAPPTLSCLFGANDGPLAGKEEQGSGVKSIVASSRVRARLVGETDNNVTLNVAKCESDAEKTVVLGRGELQIGILVEQMRREGYEMVIAPPAILTKICPDTGLKLEPYEEVVVDVDAEFAGTVVNNLTGSRRRGALVEMSDTDGKARLKFEVPSRGLLGSGPEIATTTRGTAVMHHCFLEDREWAGASVGSTGSDKGRLVSNEMGKATLFALENLANRGTLFIAVGEMVYPGMVIGENSKTGDLEVNPVKAKATNNIRTQNKEEKMYLSPPKRMNVEELIGYMNDDEVIEVTPTSVRLRKLELDAGKRERAARNRKKQLDSLKKNSAGNSKGGKR